MLRILLCLGLMFITTGCEEGEEYADRTNHSEETQSQVSIEILDYQIVEKNDISLAGTPRMTYRVILNEEELPNEDQMRRTADAILKDGNERWSEVTIFMYMPEMNVVERPTQW